MRTEVDMSSTAWTQFGHNMPMFDINVKEEPMDDTRNDSGVTSGSECPSTSPASDRSDSHPIASPPFPRQYNPWPAPQPPSSSPKALDADENSNEYHEDAMRFPKVNSHGRVKLNRCKQCDFASYIKVELYAHSRVHIKSDKILSCPKCPFVTEYKHHLEYHLLNHAGAKPFKCDQCDYSCVNKSMLNSHLKSHSKVYQYRCANCPYETKYCHSLKLHLRKYKHKPAMVLNPDGSPNPLPIIDVYGTRRGPKVKKVSESSEGAKPPKTEVPQVPMMLNQNAMLPFPLPLLPMPNQEILMGIQNMFRERLEELARNNNAPKPEQNGALDLSMSNHNSENGESDGEDGAMTTAFDNVEVIENKEADNTLTNEAERLPTKYDFSCQYCGISFGDEVMFRIHMGYHGYSNPFTCNMCGEQCENKVNFFLHIARAAH